MDYFKEQAGMRKWNVEEGGNAVLTGGNMETGCSIPAANATSYL